MIETILSIPLSSVILSAIVLAFGAALPVLGGAGIGWPCPNHCGLHKACEDTMEHTQ
jgi:hypothetical protein